MDLIIDPLLEETQRELDRGRRSCLACHQYRLVGAGTATRCAETRRENSRRADRGKFSSAHSYSLRKRAGECEWFDGRE